MKRLSAEEIRAKLLDLAKKVDGICANHDIPLFMVAGTMLGAIRHGGFIPWDDDMDFAVPYQDYEKLIDILEKELPEPYRCITFENSKIMFSSFYKVEDSSTIVDEPTYDIIKGEKPGLSIDIFPLVSCDEKELDRLIKKIHNVYMLKRRVFIGSTDRKWYKMIAKKILKSIVPFSILSLNRKTRDLMNQIQPGNMVCIPVSPHYWNRLFPSEWFVPEKKYKFEDVEFYGPVDYDGYLKMLYRNYMKLPSKEKQIVHNTNIYEK